MQAIDVAISTFTASRGHYLSGPILHLVLFSASQVHFFKLKETYRTWNEQ